MKVSRRQVFGSVAFAGAPAAAQEVSPIGAVADANGTRLTAQRLKVVENVLRTRRNQRESLRAFPVNELVEPTPGIGKK